MNESTHWFDAGVNLFSAQFADQQQSIWDASQAAGVSQWLLIGSDLAESKLNQQFCQQHAGAYTTAGIHPHQAALVDADWQKQLQLLLQLPHVVAVGECGLDFNRLFAPAEQQISIFSAQLSLAKQLQKAVYLHERDALATQLDLLNNQHIERGIAHCFTGDTKALSAYLDLGLYIGITGWLCDERRGQDLQQALAYLPLDRLILETDAPYLLPRTLQPKPKSRRNEPAFLPEIARQVALIKQCSLSELAQISTANAQRLFQTTAL